MNLNLQIISEELSVSKELSIPKYKCKFADDKFELNCTYPLRYHKNLKIQAGPVYVAYANELHICISKPHLHPANSNNSAPNLICIGDAPAYLFKSKINLMQISSTDISAEDLMEQLQDIFYRYYKWELEIREIIQNMRPLREIAAVSQTIIRNPMLCSLHGFKCIFHNADLLRTQNRKKYEEYCKSYTGSGELLEENAFPSLDVINDAISDPAWAMVAQNSEPNIYAGGKYGYPSLCYNIGPKNQKFGRLVFDGIQHNFTDRDFALIKFLGDMLGNAILLSAPMNSSPGSNLGEVLRKLLSHKLVDENEIKAELSSMGWDIFNRYFLIVLTSQAFACDVQTLSTIANGLIQQLPNTHVLIFEEKLVCIVNLTKSERSQSQFMEYALPILRDNFLIGGISIPFDDLKNLYSYYAQANRALEMGIKAEPTSWFYLYDNYMLDDLCERIIHKGTMESLIPRGLRKLCTYDEKHENNLVPLLRAYIKCGGNIAETSRELYIHRNTCLYRLRRIKEVGDIDLDNFEQRLVLSIVFATQNYCKKYGIEQ